MPKATYISAGSTTLVKSGAGFLYGMHTSPANGATIYAVDSISIGAAPNLNTDLTGTLFRVGYTGAAPDFIDTKGVGFSLGLTVSATSSARITVMSD